MLGRLFRKRKALPAHVWRHDWEHPELPRWQRRLEEVFPRTEKLNWLKIVWEPGMPQHPRDNTGISEQYVHRWVIYEMIPRLEFVPPWAIQSLIGPNPRVVGKDVLDRDEKTGDEVWFWSSHSWVSRTQWKLFRETGCWSQRYWIIQGSGGGHFANLGVAEKRFLAERGRADAEMPAPGDLPYAELDNRTIWKLMEFDRLTKWDENITWDQRQDDRTEAGIYTRRDRFREEMEFNVALLEYLDDMIHQGVESLPRREINRVVREAPRVSDRDWDYEGVEEGAVTEATNWGDR